VAEDQWQHAEVRDRPALGVGRPTRRPAAGDPGFGNTGPGPGAITLTARTPADRRECLDLLGRACKTFRTRGDKCAAVLELLRKAAAAGWLKAPGRDGSK
jgi:hypothetical protein